ncbi:MAG: hypothetical protein AB8B88_13580 [Devosiaceae bacterium]
MLIQFDRITVKRAARALALGGFALALSGCASVSLPFGSLMGDNDELHTSSIAVPVEPVETDDAPLPAELAAVTPVNTTTPSQASDRPADDLMASMPPARSNPASANDVTLTQSDLNAMGRALTHVLSTEEDSGTFSWSHEATGRSGLMTPFRALSRSQQEACRVVSVEITDGGADTILLADACLQDDQWVFVSPRPGQAL